MQEVIIWSSSLEHSFALGRAFSSVLRKGDVVALWGELGAGKTVFVQAVARGLGVGDHIPVTSPTFTIINEYDARLHIYHLDFYRITDPVELETIPWREALFGDGVALIEWPDRLGDELPGCRWDVKIEVVSERKRKFVISALGCTYEERLSYLKDSLPVSR